MVIEGHGPMPQAVEETQMDNNNNINNNNNNSVERPANRPTMTYVNLEIGTAVARVINGEVVPLPQPDANGEIKDEDESSTYARRLMESGLAALREFLAEVDRRKEQERLEELRRRAIALQEELSVRDRLNEAMFKRDVKLNSLWSFTAYAIRDLQLDEMKDCHDMFMATLTQSETRELLLKAFAMVKLCCVRTLRQLSHRFQIRIRNIDEQMDRDDRPVVCYGGWREEEDEHSNQCFINDEGLVRVDMPTGWMNEEFDRDYRFQEGKNDITNTEAFVLERVDKLLAQIKEDVERTKEIIHEIEQEIALNKNQELVVARDILGCVVENGSRTLDHFLYEFTRPIPIGPQYGITHAYHQRMARYRPNYIIELEEFFDDVEAC